VAVFYLKGKTMQRPEDMTIDELWDKYLRVLAEKENMIKQHRIEVRNAKREGIADTARGILPIMDVIEEGSRHAKRFTGRGGAVTALQDDFEAISSHARSSLSGIGINPFDVDEHEFDPERMDAVDRTPTKAHPPGRVMKQSRRGYMLEDRILRTAQVAVSVEPEKNSV
jgi:molecular chaperone GrpE